MVQDTMAELMGSATSAAPDKQAEFKALAERLAKARKMRVMRGYLAQSKRMAKTYGGIIVEKGKVVAKV